jgi:hypothetical protein
MKLNLQVQLVDGQVRFVHPYVEQKSAYFSVFWRCFVVHTLYAFFCRKVPYFPIYGTA